MFDLTTTTILSLVVPTIVAPLACLAFMRAIARSEAARNSARKPPAPARIVPAAATVLDATVLDATVLDPAAVLDSATAPLTAGRVREREPERSVA